MKKTFKGFYLLLSSLIITLLHLPFAFAKPVGSKLGSRSVIATLPSFEDSVKASISSFKSVYDSLHLELNGLSRQAFDYAYKGWQKLRAQGQLVNESIIAIVDFSQPSSNKRLYVIDMKNYKVLHHTLVAHGRNSGKEWASSFSNNPSTFKSSPGFYITGATYNGENGYSLRLQGVERGINDKAFNRAIVMHGANYVDESFISQQGYIGRSLGCPAVPAEEAKPIINSIKDGACLFIYTPDKRYTSRSLFLR